MRLNKTNLLSCFAMMFFSSVAFGQIDSTQVEPIDSLATESFQLEGTVIIGKGVIDLEEDRKTPVAATTITREQIQNKGVGNVDFTEVLKSVPSVYVSDQGGGFGDSKVFVRGFDQSNTAYLLNGQPINGMEDGNMYWSNWSAMGDIANAIQVQRGLGSSKLAISSVGGTVNIVTKATDKKQGGFARFIAGNDSYFKGTVAYNTGLKNKWGFSVLLDYWQGHRNYARGTAGEGQTYFFSVGYKPNEHHNFNFMIFGAPQYHDQNYSKPYTTTYNTNGSINTPGYDITGVKGNSNYGFYKGDALSVRRNYYHKPVANLNWDWDINSNASLSTVLYASMGRGGGTGILGRGLYHSGFNTYGGGYLGDGSVNWGAVDAYNQTLTDGISSGSNGTVLRASVNNHFWYGGVSNFKYDTKTGLTFNVGADLRFYKGDHFQQLVNLLGAKGRDASNEIRGTGYIVTDTFDADPWASLFDYADKNQRVGYDYSEWINYQGGFGQVEYSIDWFSAFVQGAVSNQSYQREDRWNNPRTYTDPAGNSINRSEKGDKIDKTGYNIKGGLAFRLNEENTVFGNIGKYSRQPYLDNVYEGTDLSGHTDNTYLRTPEVGNEIIKGVELGYKYDTKYLKFNFNVYYTEWSNRFLGLDGSNYQASDGTVYSDVKYLLSNITEKHRGIELDVQARVLKGWNVKSFATLGDWEYVGSSPYRVRDDNTYTIIQGEDGTTNLDGIKIGNAPQFSYGLGTDFEVLRGLSLDFDVNYYARLWGQNSITKIDDNSGSEELPDYVVMNGGVTYEFKFNNKSIRFRGNVMNLANQKYVVRKDGYGYLYGVGRIWNAGISYNF